MKKLTLTNELFEQLSTSEAFKTRGGSGNVNGVTGAPGSENNPIELDEVVVTPGVTQAPSCRVCNGYRDQLERLRRRYGPDRSGEGIVLTMQGFHRMLGDCSETK